MRGAPSRCGCRSTTAPCTDTSKTAFQFARRDSSITTLYEINVPGADRVEVFKGPASALYGSDAIGGVFNVLTRAPSATPTLELFVEGGEHRVWPYPGVGQQRLKINSVGADLNLITAAAGVTARVRIGERGRCGGTTRSHRRQPRNHGDVHEHRLAGRSRLGSSG